jgi:hypothetical protein
MGVLLRSLEERKKQRNLMHEKEKELQHQEALITKGQCYILGCHLGLHLNECHPHALSLKMLLPSSWIFHQSMQFVPCRLVLHYCPCFCYPHQHLYVLPNILVQDNMWYVLHHPKIGMVSIGSH